MTNHDAFIIGRSVGVHQSKKRKPGNDNGTTLGGILREIQRKQATQRNQNAAQSPNGLWMI
jgi:hypothetical protein